MATSTCPICQRVLLAGSGREATDRPPGGDDAIRRPGSDRANPAYPFCSARCKLIDLGNWLGDRYVIASNPQAELEALSDEELAALLRKPS